MRRPRSMGRERGMKRHSGRPRSMGREQALKRQLWPTAKHGARLGAKAPTLTDRKAWGESKR
ncbi:hypothetical protein BVI2075_230136 [Burkholderia vietnamiensis]|nr:hypothetical protein BVI2075_230136 [Burkholderia vietnamiensis]